MASASHEDPLMTVSSGEDARESSQFGFRQRIRNIFYKRRRTFILALMLVMFLTAALGPNMFVVVPSGHGGVLFRTFFGGTVTDKTLGEGLHIVPPWNQVFVYDLRLKVADESYDVVSSEGLHYTVRVSFRWRLNKYLLPILHKEIGYDYLKVMLTPEIGSVARARISQYTAEGVFGGQRANVQEKIYEDTVAPSHTNNIGEYVESNDKSSKSSKNLIYLENVLLKGIILPAGLKAAIVRKLEQAELAQEYQFRIEREKLESQRKKIEAEGIQQFQKTVQQGISETYLKWRGIEATLKLATSNNAKVVIVGGGSQGLPLILNTGDTPNPVSEDRNEGGELIKNTNNDGREKSGKSALTP